jgi:hypothetical protein
MKNLLNLDFVKSKKLTSVLGLVLDSSRLEGAVVRWDNGSLQTAQAFTATLSLDPLTNDAELVGREILNHLEAAEVRERRCIVGVPLKWALTAYAKLPELPEAEVEGFLQIEAERSFPCDVATLRVSTSRYVAPSGEQYATFIGIPRAHLERLEQVLHTAHVKPLSFALGISALQPPAVETSHGVLALAIGENTVDLQITCGGGVAALRSLEGVFETESGERILHGDLVAREARITLGQLPAELRDQVKHIHIFGARDLARQLAAEIRARFEPSGLMVDVVSAYPAEEFGVTIPAGAVVSPAFSLAAWQLVGRKDPFEFLAPKISPWKRITTQYSSDKLQAIGAVAAALVVLVGGAFAIQEWQLVRLNSKWTKMAPTVHDLENVQQQIRQYRPWYDDSFRSLTILRELSTVFPEDGVVTAKTLEIRDQNAVSCSGTATDNAALLRTLSQLRSADSVHDVKVVQIRGKAPIQFTFDFQYGEGLSSEN